jgi:Uma2 family endonuclease
MNHSTSYTVEIFSEQRHDLPDGGRWMELVDGELLRLDPPDGEHGTIVQNFSRKLASFLQQSESSSQAYACFELGLIVSRNPDTIRFPAACCFTEGKRFSESDKSVTEASPRWVIEIASTNQRRNDVSRRVEDYHAWGVKLVWVVDPFEKILHTFPLRRANKKFSEHQSLSAEPVFPGFQIRVADLFVIPKWWNG